MRKGERVVDAINARSIFDSRAIVDDDRHTVCVVSGLFHLVNSRVSGRVRILSLLKRLWAAVRSPFVSRPVDVRSYDELKHIHERRFVGSDAERFRRLWCEIASLCEVSPLEMHENDRLGDRCPQSRWLRLVHPGARQENLEALVLMESRHLPPPTVLATTIGDVLDYLLGTIPLRESTDLSRGSPDAR
jgi:hypothetical protein